MVSLRTFALPSSADDDKENLRWDETFAENEWKHSSIHGSGRPSLCSHALADSSFVYGVGDNSDENWTTWRTCFAPHHVCRLASNQDGSIVVASTDGGTVSLMRGRDGKILATRRVSNTEGLQPPAEIHFIANHRDAFRDSLVILVPSDFVEDKKPNVVLVSLINGEKLNSEHPSNVAEGTRGMAIDAINFDGGTDFNALQGCFLDDNTIRFAAGTTTGNISIHDFNLGTKSTKMVKENIERDCNDESYRYDTSIGIGVQHHGMSTSFFLFSALSSTKAQVVWFDILHLTVAGTVLIKSGKSCPPRVMAIEPVKSVNEDDAIAVALAFKESNESEEGTIHVLQLVIEDALGLAVLSRPHVLFTIPLGVDKGVKSVCLSIKRGESVGPYSFLLCNKTSDNCKSVVHSEFSCSTKTSCGVIGQIRLLLEKYALDEADHLCGHYDTSWDEYARFHPSEVALRKLERVLALGCITSETNMASARICLHRLASGALSGVKVAIDNLLEAANIVLDWPSKAGIPPTLFEYKIALNAIISTLESTFQAGHLHEIERKNEEVKHCLIAMKYITDFMEQESTILDKPFARARSISDLFQTLIKHNLFASAEKLLNRYRKELTPSIIVEAVVNIPSSVDPRVFALLLTETVIPSLTINHEALPLISAWTCQSADAYDDEASELGIDAAIYLLQAILSATNRLGVQLFSSFASFSPFVSEILSGVSRSRQPSPRNSFLTGSTEPITVSIRSNSSEMLQSRPSVTSAARKERPMPTVLELGRMKGGAMVSVLPSLRSSCSNNAEEDDDVDTTVAVKLIHAIQLKEARRLGLNRGEVRLQHYGPYGGAARVANELVRIFSSRPQDHDTRLSSLAQEVKSFCSRCDVSYDDAIFSYATDLCNSKIASESAITEVSSLSRCCDSNTSKCKVALSVLRAALLCGKPSSCLSKLSKDAIGWAGGDTSLKSEVIEASRLLVIDSIVRRYCGVTTAHELFRVDNPQHAKNLLDFVCCHVEIETIFLDALDLCEAFTDLSKTEASIHILQRAVISGNSERCKILANEMFQFNTTLAVLACDQAIEYACDALADLESKVLSKFEATCKAAKEDSISTCKAALIVADILKSNESRNRGKGSIIAGRQHQDWHGLLTRVSQLQEHHDTFISPLCLLSSQYRFTKAKQKIESLLKFPNIQDFSCISLTDGKRICKLFVGPNQDEASQLYHCIIGEIALTLIWKHDHIFVLNFIRSGGLLEDHDNVASSRALVAIVMSLCTKASIGQCTELSSRDDTVESFMMNIISASSVIQEHVIVDCPEVMLEEVSTLAVLTTTAKEVLKRLDGGVGERLNDMEYAWSTTTKNSSPIKLTQHNGALPSLPKLHPSWYIGDGLLLPPDDASAACISYCNEELAMLSFVTKSKNTEIAGLSGTLAFHRLLSDRGAHSYALSIVSRSFATFVSTFDDSDVDCLWQSIESSQETVRHLTERSLGGSGNGITSVIVDSELAVPYILSLPIKLAFKIYRSSLPTAITQRDFERLLNLANVGIQGGHFGSAVAGWKKQNVFVAQCERLSMKARWWGLLRKLDIDFDPRKFDDDDNKSETDLDSSRTESRYIASLLAGLVKNASIQLRDVDLARDLVVHFAKSFRLDTHLALQRHIEYLLSGTMIEYQKSENTFMPVNRIDARMDLPLCETAARASLGLIDSAMKRASILRQCLVALEHTEDCDTDYERHSIVLSLYHTDLVVVVARDQSLGNHDVAPLEEELEMVERRRDALSILISFFHGKYEKCRPKYPHFFARLPVLFKFECGSGNSMRCGVLGITESKSSDVFDPLEPLALFLSKCSDVTTSTAIAPLCIPLGLPHGYIHARGLLARFSSAAENKCTLPSLLNDVMPVLSKIKSPKDQAILAEHCALQYDDNDEQKLVCLDKAIEFAMQSSNEIEVRLRRFPSDDLLLDEFNALEAVRRLTTSKSVLSDKCHVMEILKSNKIESDQFRTVKVMIDDLTEKLNQQFWTSSDTSPDRFVELLLTESSQLAAEACMDDKNSFSIGHFRYLASVVHKTCREISEQYSHIHTGHTAKRLSRRWLVYGDTVSQTAELGNFAFSESTSMTWKDPGLSIVAEDETVNFVMDLNAAAMECNGWTVGSIPQESSQRDAQLNKEEEPSGLMIGGSDREASDRALARASLRIAFLMSFADEYYSNPQRVDATNVDQENMKSSSNVQSKRQFQKRSRVGLLSRISVHEAKEDNMVLDHAKELLSIVFAESAGSGRFASDISVSFLGTCEGVEGDTRNTVTFAMRHRALRTAAILCPQYALEKVIRDEGYLVSSMNEVCSLSQCSFASFVAKEIEEMRLPLPHSDLTMLSAMDFHSFARALWRHHRGGDSKGVQGRLLSLLLEMSTREKEKVDKDFCTCLMDEMTRLKLPRTILHACETFVERLKDESDHILSASVLSSLAMSAKTILSEFQVGLAATDSTVAINGLPTLQRLGNVAEKIADIEGGQVHIIQFCSVLMDLLPHCPRGDTSSAVAILVLGVVLRIKEETSRVPFLERLACSEEGKLAFQQRFPKHNCVSASTAVTGGVLFKFQQLEGHGVEGMDVLM